MRVRVLGGLRVGTGGADDRPTAPKQRQLFGLLLMKANETVPVATCVAELWGGEPPKSGGTTLQTYVMHLRKILVAERDPVATLLTDEWGYRLRIRPQETDLGVAESWIRQGDEAFARGDLVQARRMWRQALTLWRGRVLVDVRAGPVLTQAIEHLEQWRAAVLVRYFDVELRLGRHRQVLAELTTAVDRHPLAERLHGTLMLALYRSGRQAEALQAYRRLRAVLHAELAVAPSPDIDDLHQAIRAGDARLDPPRLAPAVLPPDIAVPQLTRDLAAFGAGWRLPARPAHPVPVRRGPLRSEATSCPFPSNAIPT